jgi:hypothetical protein
VRAGRHVQTFGLVVDEIEQAQVRKRLDGHARDIRERFVDFQGTVKHLPGSNEQC